MSTGKGARASNVLEDIIKPNYNLIASLREEGKTEKDIALELGIGYRTLCTYKSKDERLKQVLKKSKRALIANLERSLYQKGLGGFSITKITRKYVVIGGVKQDDMEEITETTIEQAPDLGALIFSLKNLAPEKWKDKQEINESVDELTNAVKGFLNGVANDSN